MSLDTIAVAETAKPITLSQPPLHRAVGLTPKVPALHPVELVADRTGVAAQRLLDLADAGYLPHWRIDGGPPMFVIQEVKDWVAANLVVRCEGTALPTRFFVVTDRSPADVRMLPTALRDISGLRDISDVVSLRSGIYFLCHRHRVVYVGQAAVAARRIHEHLTSKDFDQVFFLPWPRWDLDQVEGAFIRLLEPPLNRAEGGWLVARGDPGKDTKTLETTKTLSQTSEGANGADPLTV
jgi:hypothetical protein